MKKREETAGFYRSIKDTVHHEESGVEEGERKHNGSLA